MYNEALKNIIREAFPSTDMQEYLCAHTENLRKWQIVDMVRKALIPLWRKLELFTALAEYEDRKSVEAEIKEAEQNGDNYEISWIKENSYHYQAEAISRALSELIIRGKEEGVLLFLERQRRDGKEEVVGELPFFSYEKLITYIRKDYAEWEETEIEKFRPWYVIEKYKEMEEGKLVQTHTYVVFKGEIMYFEEEGSDMGSDVLWGRGDLNVPVSFQPGDIIRVDGKPTCEEKIAVVLRVGDNLDCCSLEALYKNKDGFLDSPPVKHSDMFYETESAFYYPPLYTAKLVTEKLERDETAFELVRDFIAGDEWRGWIVDRNTTYGNFPASALTKEFLQGLARSAS